MKKTIQEIFLLLATTLIILYFFPKGASFKYDFQKGKPWLYENLYAPIDFPIYKTKEMLDAEKEDIKNDFIPYYNYDHNTRDNVVSDYKNNFNTYFSKYPEPINKQLYELGYRLLQKIYKNGVWISNEKNENAVSRINVITENNTVRTIDADSVFAMKDLKNRLNLFFNESELDQQQIGNFYELFYEILNPNIQNNTSLSQKVLNEDFKNIALTRGKVEKGKRIIAKGEIIDFDTYVILTSLKGEYESKDINDNKTLIIFSYFILIFIPLGLLLIYIRQYHPKVYADDKNIAFIYINIILMVIMTHFIVSYESNLIFIVPLSILPIILNTFFGIQIAIISHVTCTLLIVFMIPNTLEFIFAGIITGIVVILTSSGIYKRSKLFIAVGKIIATYLIVHIFFLIIQEGANFYKSLYIDNLSLFFFNGLAILFVQPLTYAYEKLFNLVSGVSLLELSDTNSKLLKRLSEKAPGTFQHSIQVASLAETVASVLGANVLLTRVGALYHDIGKMNMPFYFIENQNTKVNPHDDISYKESAKIIINHVTEGIAIAKKNNLPQCIIDFIQTHHGTTNARYFYLKEKESNPNIDIKDFTYPGPTPFTKETSIVMMADAVEASSKSIKNPTQEIINNFVDRIIDQQIAENQLYEANITFKEVNTIKQTLKKRLMNIYNLRIEYPKED